MAGWVYHYFMSVVDETNRILSESHELMNRCNEFDTFIFVGLARIVQAEGGGGFFRCCRDSRRVVQRQPSALLCMLFRCIMYDTSERHRRIMMKIMDRKL